MTYIPDDHRAGAALEALRAGPAPRFADQPHQWDRAALRQLLVAVVCPAPCVGVTEPGGKGWHAACERAADDALAALDRDRLHAWGLTPPPGVGGPGEG